MTRETPKVVLADEGRCAYARHCYPSHAAKDTRKSWCAKHDLYRAGDRAYALVSTIHGIQYMDAVTGHLFDHGPKYIRDQEWATEKLFAMKKQREVWCG